MVKSDSKIIILQHFPKFSLTGLPCSKKLKMQNLTISSFTKGQILKNETGQISIKKFIKITKINLEFHKRIEICSDLSETGQKMAKPFNFWQTVSKKGQKATLKSNSLIHNVES
jgi:hypothetical protein